MTKRRVVVTGLGLITPVGIGVTESWENIVNGVSGITNISKFDTSSFKSQVAGEVKNFNPDMYLNAKDSKRMDTFMQFGLVAGIEAIKDSGFVSDENSSLSSGVMVGSGIGGLDTIYKNSSILDNQGIRKISPFFISL